MQVGRCDDGLYVWQEKGHSSCSLIVVVVWRHIVQKGDTVIDATCGNGYDTLAMVKMVADETHSGHVRGLVELFGICHSKMEELVPKGVPMRLVAFNLGYLPGGDKALITRSETTLQALEAAKRMLAPGGLISIYSGLCGPSWRKGGIKGRLFSCGTNQNGETHLVEWIKSKGTEQISYKGLQKHSLDIEQFDTTKDSFLETLCIRFNGEGTLLAASVRNNIIKILEALNGIQSLRAYEMIVSIIAAKIMGTKGARRMFLKQLKSSNQQRGRSSKKLVSLLNFSPCCFLVLSKWLRCKATMKNPPQLWHPISGILMTNDLTNVRTEETKPCFALSRNDAYLISTSGGQVSLFNITCKTMATFTRPPPVPMYFAFYPHNNNIIAIGMDDSTDLIYEARANEVKSKLED
ncbi:unnamed protein product [Camellia sinensis]